ncbi:early transcribed membrane protein (ETRAMP) [Plasmodium ovale wallikeri]|uniref:Early transcribed membrane protein (ETRAMP) n=2 Tax=Plasmodium ovale TaxID=36330 RepID=A0A1A8YLK1_PLAOA|nr:early transcribed membrane protein (ETRAMP) [Plasmodium ovale wallikeri]SBT32432.1 early transcribed membrane protein (ETRAMP) [Plasmodium ovale wallikeri]SBT75760.1 early transcribed membrane protein, putative [Plasmodium ovale]
MKITKILYLFAALLAVNFIAPSFYNNTVSAKKVAPGYKKLTDAEKKKRNQKIMMISSIASGVALLLGTALGLGIHYKNKHDNKKGAPAAKKEPLLGAVNNQNKK